MEHLKPYSQVKIASYKYDGTIHRLWQDNTILHVSEDLVIGVNDATEVIERDGNQWVTKEPAVFYFSKTWWFNVIGLLKEDEVYYYCNLSSPYIYHQQTIKYIDYDLDIIVYPDMSYRLLDLLEFHQNKRRMNYPRDLTYILEQAQEQMVTWIKQMKEPFAPCQTKKWYEQYQKAYPS